MGKHRRPVPASLDIATVAWGRMDALTDSRSLEMIELTLPTMTCSHCVQAVTRTVQQVDPAARPQIDLPTHRVRIDSAQPVEAFAKALAEEGYAPA
jgi:copper chaperone